MKTILKIENVTIEKTEKGLVYFLPSNFSGNDLKEFKKRNNDEIMNFKKLTNESETNI